MARARRMAERAGVPLPVVLLTALHAVLWRHTLQDDLPVAMVEPPSAPGGGAWRVGLLRLSTAGTEGFDELCRRDGAMAAALATGPARA